MILQCIGCSHHTSDVAIREKLAFSEEQASSFLEHYYHVYPDSEAVLLSTCNRTEFYTASRKQELGPDFDQMQDLLALACGLNPSEIRPYLFDHSNIEAIRHLFSVAASLDSMVLGETQILAQVKKAYQLATQMNRALPLTHQVFQSAIRVAKRVAKETDIHDNRISIPSIAIGDFARQIFERFDDKKTLVIGAGEMGEETLQYVRHFGGRDIIVTNRTVRRAIDLADRCGGRVSDWSDLLEKLADADLVVSTTSSSEPIVTADQFVQVRGKRIQKPIFILDLAIPRDFEASIGQLENVYLYSIDDLQAQCNHNRKSRRSNWPKAKKIIDQEASTFMNELGFRNQAPMIARLKEQASVVKESELKRLFNKLGDLNDHQREEIGAAFHRLTNKLLHPPLESIREQKDDDQKRLLDAVRRLFKLGD